MSHSTRLCQLIQTKVGRKMVVAVSGLLLSAFAVTHMAGNLLLLVGPEAYNKYSHALISNPFIYLAEAGLVLLFLVHLSLAARLCLENRRSRADGYLSAPIEKGASFAAKSMVYSGLLIFVFLVSHLVTFKYGTHYSIVYQGVEMRDLYRLVLESFRNPFYTGWYVISLLVLGLHLSHGLSAALQSLGVASALGDGNRHRKIGMAVAAVLVLGFLSQPLYLIFMGVN